MNIAVATARLADPEVAEVILGQSPSSSAYNETAEGWPFFQGKADFGLLHPTPRVWTTEGTKFAEANDVLVSVRAPVGDVNIATGDAVIGRGVAALRASGQTDHLFLYFALQHMKPVLEAQATGSTFASINGATLRDLEIPYFGHDQQSAIGRVLMLLIAQVEREGAAAACARELKQAVMAHVFARGLRGEDQKETEIGPIPESWEVVELGTLGRIGNGSTPKRSVAEYWTGGTFPWLSSAKVYDRDIEVADQFVTGAALAECHLPRLQPGAVLVAITGQGKTLGHVAVLRTEATINQHLAYLQTDLSRADPGYVRGYLETLYESMRQVASGGGSTKGALTCVYLRGVDIPLPSTLGEQREVVEVLDAIDKKVKLHRRKRDVLDQLFKSLLHKLMTGKISVDDVDLSALPAAQRSAA